MLTEYHPVCIVSFALVIYMWMKCRVTLIHVEGHVSATIQYAFAIFYFSKRQLTELRHYQKAVYASIPRC